MCECHCTGLMPAPLQGSECSAHITIQIYMKKAGAHMYNMVHMPTYKVRKQSVKQSPLCPASQNDLPLATVLHMVPFRFLPFLAFSFWLVEHFDTNSQRCFSEKLPLIRKCWSVDIFLCRLPKQDGACSWLTSGGSSWWILFSFHAAQLL